MVTRHCTSCGAQLVAEGFAGPPRREFATEFVADIAAFRAGWRDGVCWECRTSAVP